jgi:uncharacterized protein YbjT (DUF2867 family)
VEVDHPVKVLLLGGSGMVGQGVLRECLLASDVTSVLSVGRSPTGRTDPKLLEIVRADLTDLGPVEPQLTGYDAGFFCLGVSSVGKTEADYRRVTHDLTLRVAGTLARLNPGMTFVYVSGAGTDSTGKGRSMWARVKGQTENDLLRLPFKAAYMFRPGAIQPRHGIRSKTAVYRLAYLIVRPFLPIISRVAPNSITTTDQVGRAMLAVVRQGPTEQRVETRDINRLGA